jgi:hypothetical protein
MSNSSADRGIREYGNTPTCLSMPKIDISQHKKWKATCDVGFTSESPDRGQKQNGWTKHLPAATFTPHPKTKFQGTSNEFERKYIVFVILKKKP